METEGKRRTKYYNKRPAGGEERSRGNGAKRQPFVSGRFEGGELEDWVEGSTDEAGGEIGWKAGGYLQRLKVWRQRQPACTTAGPCLIGSLGRRAGCNGAQEEEGSVWPRNRRPDELNID